MITFTTLPAIAFPVIDPVIFAIGPLAVRWYALAYIVGLVLGWRYCMIVARRAPQRFNPELFDDLLFYATLGVVLGGRAGYVLFYNLPYFLENPLKIFMVWQGGMSFHGGMLGVGLATLWYARRHKIHFLALLDVVAAAAPIGLFFGRIANFFNGELFGRISDVPWAMAFPRGGPEPRHPSQLYEAGLEGLVLFVVIAILAANAKVRSRLGTLTGVFLIGYGLARGVVELVREPDAHLGLFLGGVTMGQILSAPMILLGAYLVIRAGRAVQSAGHG